MKTRTTLRIEQLASMHNLIMQSNDEFVVDAWLNYFPEEANEDEFVFFCENDEEYQRITKIFRKLIVSENFYY